MRQLEQLMREIAGQPSAEAHEAVPVETLGETDFEQIAPCRESTQLEALIAQRRRRGKKRNAVTMQGDVTVVDLDD